MAGKDSANEKRYARRGRAGEVEEAFGFSLALLLARSAEIVADWCEKSNDAMAVVLRGPTPRDPRIIADPALKQVFSALLDNAHEAGAERMVIAASLDDELLSVEFNDDGPGFAPEILERMGQPYQSTKGRAGAGLGLFLLVNVMRKLGGGVAARNRRDGGACVRLTLPLEALAAK